MNNIDVLARTIFGEGRNQDFIGQVAIAYVIKTRSEERNDSITNVCLAPKQFSCWDLYDPNRKIIEMVGLDNPSFVTAYGIACLVINGKLENPVPGANHYITVKAPEKDGVALTWPPEWAKSMKLIRVIGAHEFLRGN